MVETITESDDPLVAAYKKLVGNEALRASLQSIGADSLIDASTIGLFIKTVTEEVGLNYGAAQLGRELGHTTRATKLAIKSLQQSLGGQGWDTVTGGDPQLEEGQHWRGLSHPQNRQGS